MIGIVVGFAAEAAIAEGLGGRLAIGGGDAAGAATAARGLALAGVSALLSFGLAGGLLPTLRAGDLVIPECVVTAASERFDTGLGITALLGNAGGAVFAADHILARRADKAAAWAQTAALAVDLESGAVARVAAEYRLPFAVLRAVCDPAGRDLPPAALVALDGSGHIQPVSLLRSIARRPAQLPGLAFLARDALFARRALQRRVVAIGSLPP